ncbi:MAG: SpoIVB peptidase S55 domain-containing protein, partial [Planctomycetota bacterium]
MKKRFSIIVMIFLTTSGAFSAQKPASIDSLDSSKYITVDEVKPGMQAYCLTIFEGTEIEKFELEVLSVVRNFRTGMDAILVKGLDERFIHTGPVGGCSGSPVYIEGRMAGALAFGWTFSKDPLYGVTPIKDMLRVGQANYTQNLGDGFKEPSLAFDYSSPVNIDNIQEMLFETAIDRKNTYGSLEPLPCPLIISGLPSSAFDYIGPQAESLGFMAVPGIGS